MPPTDGSRWEVPYLAIDPKDIGRTYDAVVRVNSQSGKGGVAYLLGAEHGLRPAARPAGRLQPDHSSACRGVGRRDHAGHIREAFDAEYVHRGRLRLAQYETSNDGVAGTPCTIDAVLTDGIVSRTVYGDGTGPIDAFVDALQRAFGLDVHVRDFREHALRAGEDASAVAYVELSVGGETRWGAGVDPNIVTASLAAIVSAASESVSTLEPVRKETHAALAV